jgi:ribosomal protein S12 methylthiotransferase accessory factor
MEAMISPITGIAKRLTRYEFVPSAAVIAYGAETNVALPPPSLRLPESILHPVISAGRGGSDYEARLACLAEAVERYSIQFRGDEYRCRASYADLGSEAIHPDTVQLFSGRQLAGRDRWNREHKLDQGIPELFHKCEEIDWAVGWSLTSRSPRYLPMALCALSYRPPGNRWIGDADSSGCATGSCLEEAILHGLFELVERDAVGIWWYNQACLPAFGSASIGDSMCRKICAQLEGQGWRTWVQDITTDLHIPAIVAIGVDAAGRWVRGSSAHVSRSTALRQALMELWQLSRGTTRAEQERRPLPPYSKIDADEFQSDDAGVTRVTDLKTIVEDTTARLLCAGCEAAVFDMTRPELALPVVRVVAPGLRHSKPRFAPGRLFEVPVRLGWFQTPRAEDDMPTAFP